ncbi:MAG: hypothetical protein JWO11_1915 [Nocardioides sp.]|nr:hypothetical protein [Nocardioides sp.]
MRASGGGCLARVVHVETQADDVERADDPDAA